MAISGNKTRDITIRLHIAGQSDPVDVLAKAGSKLSEAIWLSGKIPPISLCGGLGRCGRCRMRFMNWAPAPTAADREFFSAADLEEGWRLSCCHKATGPDASINIELPPQPEFFHNLHLDPAATGSRSAFLGIDLGTTSIQWQAVTGSGAVAACGSMPNPQGAVGADLVARIAHALTQDGLAQLSSLVWDGIKAILTTLAQAGFAVTSTCVAANSAMTEIFLRKDVSGLASSPWSLSYEGGEIIRRDAARFVFPPLFSPFIGGDISAGILALLHARTPRPFLLADLGTNAELAIVDENLRLFMASVPLGPALEGIGPLCGQPASENVITAFTSDPKGLKTRGCGTDTAAGISATGYISLLALLLRMGIMDRHGHFCDNARLPMATAIAANLGAMGDMPVLNLPLGMRLTANDVEILLKVKAAFATALRMLMQTSGLGPARLARVCIAGALGEHTASADLATLGFIPPVLAARTRPCGNTSLAGATLLAHLPQKMRILLKMRASATILQLANDPQFLNTYLSAMTWDWNAS